MLSDSRVAMEGKPRQPVHPRSFDGVQAFGENFDEALTQGDIAVEEGTASPSARARVVDWWAGQQVRWGKSNWTPASWAYGILAVCGVPVVGFVADAVGCRVPRWE